MRVPDLEEMVTQFEQDHAGPLRLRAMLKTLPQDSFYSGDDLCRTIRTRYNDDTSMHQAVTRLWVKERWSNTIGVTPWRMREELDDLEL